MEYLYRNLIDNAEIIFRNLWMMCMVLSVGWGLQDAFWMLIRKAERLLGNVGMAAFKAFVLVLQLIFVVWGALGINATGFSTFLINAILLAFTFLLVRGLVGRAILFRKHSDRIPFSLRVFLIGKKSFVTDLHKSEFAKPVFRLIQ